MDRARGPVAELTIQSGISNPSRFLDFALDKHQGVINVKGTLGGGSEGTANGGTKIMNTRLVLTVLSPLLIVGVFGYLVSTSSSSESDVAVKDGIIGSVRIPQGNAFDAGTTISVDLLDFTNERHGVRVAGATLTDLSRRELPFVIAHSRSELDPSTPWQLKVEVRDASGQLVGTSRDRFDFSPLDFRPVELYAERAGFRGAPRRRAPVIPDPALTAEDIAAMTETPRGN